MLIRFSHVMIYSRNHEASVRWYCDKLGFEIDYNAPGEYASLHHESLGRLAIHASDGDVNTTTGPIPYLLCDDIQQTVEELKKKDIVVSKPEREGESPWFCEFKDIDGNIWGIEEQ